VSTILAANLPPVSTTSVAHCHQYQRQRRKKIIKTLLIEDFIHLLPVSGTPVAYLELRISPQIFEKILKGHIGILRGLGEID
jgi:hypothetical protein